MVDNNRSTQRFTFPDGSSIDITTISPEAERQAQTNRQLREAGIDLAPEQEAQLQQAFTEAIANTLTPQQQQQWEQYLSDRTDRQAQANSSEFPIQRDHAREARDWEAIKQAFREARMPLTPEQEAQLQQIHKQMANVLEPEFRANPMRALVELISPFYLPEWIARRMFRSSAVANSLLVYVEAVRTILTPEQHQFWERYLSDRPSIRE